MNQKIDTKLGTAIIIIFAITVGALVWKYENNKNAGVNDGTNIPKILNTNNHYSNNDYGFSLDLPNSTDKYIIQVSPNTIGKISFLLPVTNQIYTTRYTGHTWADTFNILAYPKIKIDEIKKDCEQDSSQNKPYYKCTLINSEPIAENKTYSFYSLKGGTEYPNVPLAFESNIYSESENALKTFKVFPALLSFDENAWRVYKDNKLGLQTEYPNDWYLNFRIPTLDNQNVNIGGIHGPIGSIGFDNNYINNSQNSIEQNIEFINNNRKIKLSNPIFKKINIYGGYVFFNPSKKNNMPLERQFFIVGDRVILNGTFQSNIINQQKTDKVIEILSRFKFFQQ